MKLSLKQSAELNSSLMYELISTTRTKMLYAHFCMLLHAAMRNMCLLVVISLSSREATLRKGLIHGRLEIRWWNIFKMRMFPISGINKSFASAKIDMSTWITATKNRQIEISYKRHLLFPKCVKEKLPPPFPIGIHDNPIINDWLCVYMNMNSPIYMHVYFFFFILHSFEYLFIGQERFFIYAFHTHRHTNTNKKNFISTHPVMHTLVCTRYPIDFISHPQFHGIVSYPNANEYSVCARSLCLIQIGKTSMICLWYVIYHTEFARIINDRHLVTGRKTWIWKGRHSTGDGKEKASESDWIGEKKLPMLLVVLLLLLLLMLPLLCRHFLSIFVWQTELRRVFFIVVWCSRSLKANDMIVHRTYTNTGIHRIKFFGHRSQAWHEIEVILTQNASSCVCGKIHFLARNDNYIGEWMINDIILCRWWCRCCCCCCSCSEGNF